MSKNHNIECVKYWGECGYKVCHGIDCEDYHGGRLVAIEDIEIKWKEILHMIIDAIWAEKGRVNDEKTST